MKRNGWSLIGVVGAALAVSGSVVLAAEDKYAAKVPDGLSLSEIRGYEDWATVAVSQVEGGQKVIVANPAMIAAYKAGTPGGGKAFPDGSKIVKIEWSQKRMAESPYFAMTPDKLMSVSFIEKDSKRFPNTHGWGYAQFQYDAAADTFKGSGTGTGCGNACHTAVAAKDYMFTPYAKR